MSYSDKRWATEITPCVKADSRSKTLTNSKSLYQVFYENSNIPELAKNCTILLKMS